MARTDALSINIDANTADKLAEIQGFVIETIQKGAVSEKMKNTEYSGDPTTGSIEIDRFKNATVDDYGTARTAGAGKQSLHYESVCRYWQDTHCAQAEIRGQRFRENRRRMR